MRTRTNLRWSRSRSSSSPPTHHAGQQGPVQFVEALPPLRARIDLDEVERFCVYLMHGACQRSIGVGSSEPAAVSRGRGERNRRVVADSTKFRKESADEDRDEVTTVEI